MSFTFNGISSDSFGIIVRDIKRPLLPDQNDNYLQIPGRHGSYLFNRELNDRIIEIDCVLADDTIESLRDKLRQIAVWLYVDERKPLSFADELDKYYLAKLDGVIDVEQIIAIGQFTLRFRCEPLAYGKLVRVNLDNNTKIYNKGTYPSKGMIKIEITEETDHLEVTLLNTREFLYIDDNFDTGDIVVIDLEKEYVTKNDYSAMPNLYLESDFFEIPVGEFEIAISNGNGILEFRERWL